MLVSSPKTRCLGKLALTTLICGVVLELSPFATAQTKNCIQDEFTQAGNTQTLGCTANDVRIAEAINTRALDGTSLNTCTPGQNYNFIADFLVQTSSKSTRSNIGLYLALDSTAIASGALTGQCADNIIGGPGASGSGKAFHYMCPNQTATTPLCGSTNYDEFDASPDNCGDSSSTDPTVYLSAPDANGNAFVVSSPVAGGSTWTSTQVVTVEIDGFTCPNTPGKLVSLPDCTSWQVPGKTLSCISNGPNYMYPPSGAIPGTTSKCNCSTVTLPIRVQTPGITVTKNCASEDGTISSSFPTSTSCTLPDPGLSTSNNVKYTVGISNNSNFGDIAVDQICDSAYGTVYRASGISINALAACSVAGNVQTTTCGSTAPLNDVTGSTSCTFDVFQPEGKTVPDIVTVAFHGLSTTGTVTYLSAQSNIQNGTPTAISVTTGEDTTTGTITGSAKSLTNVCETVTYEAKVTNTSTAAEETLSVSKLYDNNVDLTTIANGVLGTTCGVATGQNGLGTLNTITVDSSNGGSLAAKLTGPSGSYTCDFQTQYCAAPSTVVKTPGTCSGNTVGSTCTAGNMGAACTSDAQCNITCTGIQAQNSITADLADDENGTISVGATATVKPGSAPATMCVTFP